MSNPITGDFEGVLQVSGGTVNRLLATMHQNAFTNVNLPSFPHVIRTRIGDDHAIDGVHGLVHGQIGVPRVELIHGATDRFVLDVGVRAWYRPDTGSTTLPAFIHGTVRAEYRFEKINPQCFGWAKLASQYLWVRVVTDSVQFQGTTAEDHGAIEEIVITPVGGAAAAAAEAANIAKVQKQIAGLLAHRFEATPHPIKPGFRRDLMRSLNAPIGGSAVAIALGLSGEPVGSIASVDNLILDGADIGFGINIAFLLSLAQPMLDKVSGFNQSFPVHKDLPLKDFDTVYRVSVDPPTIEWDPHIWYGLIKVKVHGTATTDSVAANATFDVEQHVMLSFDAGRGSIVASALAPIVKTHASGLYGGTVADRTADEVFKAVDAMAKAAVNQIQPTLDAIPARSAPLVDQLKTLDPQAGISFTDGLFVRDGIIIRGRVALSSRHAPVLVQAKLPSDDGHTAVESWIPGGRIDRLEWSWIWSGSTPAGKVTFDDRFILRRPGGKTGRWGAGIALQMPLPGIDGWGTLCLKIKGVHVDDVTGALVAVESTRACKRFGFNISDRVHGQDRLLLRDVPQLSKDVPFPQLSVVRVGDAHEASTAANTLVLLTGDRWDADTASVMKEGLARCRRYDAGLALLVLFREGVLEARGPRLIADVEAFAQTAGIAAIVNEDVNGSWSRRLRVPGDGHAAAWALISPQGNVTWRYEGRASADVLTNALDTYLHPSPDASPGLVRPGLEIGAAIPAIGLDTGLFDLAESRCPAPPVGRGRAGVGQAVVTFVRSAAGATGAHLRQLYADYGQRDENAPLVVVVLDGADAREAEALRNELGVDFAMVPDPIGTIADRVGVGTWPTTATVDEAGTVSKIETGVRPGPGASPQKSAEAE